MRSEPSGFNRADLRWTWHPILGLRCPTPGIGAPPLRQGVNEQGLCGVSPGLPLCKVKPDRSNHDLLDGFSLPGCLDLQLPMEDSRDIRTQLLRLVIRFCHTAVSLDTNIPQLRYCGQEGLRFIMPKKNPTTRRDVVKVSLLLPDDVHRAFKLKTVSEGTSIQAVLEGAVVAYLDQPQRRGAPRIREG